MRLVCLYLQPFQGNFIFDAQRQDIALVCLLLALDHGDVAIGDRIARHAVTNHGQTEDIATAEEIVGDRKRLRGFVENR